MLFGDKVNRCSKCRCKPTIINADHLYEENFGCTHYVKCACGNVTSKYAVKEAALESWNKSNIKSKWTFL